MTPRLVRIQLAIVGAGLVGVGLIEGIKLIVRML